MARMLGRSKSLRMLKGGHKESHQQTQRSTPPPANFQVDLDRLKASTPVPKADGQVETPDMSQRPKISARLGDHEKPFHKKVAPGGQISPDDQDFVFPFPSPTKSATVLYTAGLEEDREGVIGIALGSPTMASPWNTTPPATDFVTSNQGTVTHISSNNPSHAVFPESADTKQDAPKPKLSRWKSLFKKSPASQNHQNSFYQLAQSVSPARVDSHHDDESLDSRTTPRLEDSRTLSPPTFKPTIRESRMVPKGQVQPPVERPRALTIGIGPSGKPKTSLLRSASSPKPPPKDRWKTSPTVPQVVVSGGSQNGSPRTNGDRPLLDVNIPSIQMERYSVMFGSLLQPNSNSSSSLLVRRQGNPERLKPLNELTKKNEGDGSRNGTLKPQRRATSPSFPKSPGLSLFPQPTSGHNSRTPSPRAVSVHRPRPLQRSKTAPSNSPNRRNFPSQEGAKEVFHDTKKSENENGDLVVETPLSLTPTPSSRRSFDSGSEEVTIVVARGTSWKPQVEENEPQWEIISKPSDPAHKAVSQDQAQPSSAPLESSSRAEFKARTQILSPAPRSADMPTEPQDRSQATVGVARSVSVSRANKPEFLSPTLMNRATDSSERLVDRRALTPTLVELKNRKSQRVQLVDV